MAVRISPSTCSRSAPISVSRGGRTVSAPYPHSAAADNLLVKSAQQDWRHWELVVMTTGDSQRPTERIVLPGIWNLNNPNALLSDGGRVGQKALGGVFDLKNGPDIRIVSAAWGDWTPDGIRIRHPGVLELPGFGTG